jgi:phosphoserine phosphatase RsbU/P
VYLAGLEYEVTEADSAEQALKLCRSAAFDALIADVNLPGTNGIGFLKRLRAGPSAKLRDMAVILLTGEKNEDLRAEGLEAGGDAFVTKPVDGPQLRDALATALGKRSR